MQVLEYMVLKEYTFLAKVVGGGKITIPLEVRSALGIEDGNRIEATVKIIDDKEKT